MQAISVPCHLSISHRAGTAPNMGMAFTSRNMRALRQAVTPSYLALASLTTTKYGVALANNPGTLVHGAGLAPTIGGVSHAAPLAMPPPPPPPAAPPATVSPSAPLAGPLGPTPPLSISQPHALGFPDLSNARANQTKRLFDAALADPDRRKALMEQVTKDVSRTLDTTNPHTQRHKQQTLVNWTTLVGHKYPQRKSDFELWETDIVLNEARTYFSLRVCYVLFFCHSPPSCPTQKVQLTPGRDGGPVTSKTLRGWVTHFFTCVLAWAHDRVTGARTGAFILVTHGLFDTMNQFVIDRE